MPLTSLLQAYILKTDIQSILYTQACSDMCLGQPDSWNAVVQCIKVAVPKPHWHKSSYDIIIKSYFTHILDIYFDTASVQFLSYHTLTKILTIQSPHSNIQTHLCSPTFHLIIEHLQTYWQWHLTVKGYCNVNLNQLHHTTLIYTILPSIQWHSDHNYTIPISCTNIYNLG